MNPTPGRSHSPFLIHVEKEQSSLLNHEYIRVYHNSLQRVSKEGIASKSQVALISENLLAELLSVR